MKLYHGSNLAIDKIDFSKCRPFKDFGQGFYLTPIYDHAHALALNRVVRYGGDPVVNAFDFDYESALEDKALKIKVFKKPDRDWVEFIMKNRDDSHGAPIQHDFDIVIGPIANDRIAASISLFENEFISIDELIERLKYKELSIQYFFRTQEALSYLKRI